MFVNFLVASVYTEISFDAIYAAVAKSALLQLMLFCVTKPVLSQFMCFSCGEKYVKFFSAVVLFQLFLAPSEQT